MAKQYVAYYRVSTKRQGRSGLGLEAQQRMVADRLGPKADLIAEFTEAESGRRSDRHRPELRKAIQLVQANRDCVLVVAKMDRLTRNLAFLSILLDSDVSLLVCDIPDMACPHQARFILQLMANLAEFDAGTISERVKAAHESKRRRGIAIAPPTPKSIREQGQKAAATRADEFARTVAPVLRELQRYGCDTIGKLQDGLEARGVSTRTKKKSWSYNAVKYLLQRLAEKPHLDAQTAQRKRRA